MREQDSKIRIHEGNSPLVISVPHAGTLVPPEYRERMRPEALFLPDTDWYVDKLYEFAPDKGASLIVTHWSRYVIDPNRPSDNAPLYASHSGSALVPVRTFSGDEIYLEGQVPGQDEVEQRLATFWRPYHERLESLLGAARERHGFAVLLDGHSIRSVVPELFDGKLPHLNLGTNSGASACGSLSQRAWKHLEDSGFTAVRDERFRGGYITRHYGRPQHGVHALQLEIAQRAYMPESPPQWDMGRARPLISMLRALVDDLQQWQPGGAD